MRGVVTLGGNTDPPLVPEPPAPPELALELEALVAEPPVPVVFGVPVAPLVELLLVALELAPPVPLPFVAPVVPGAVVPDPVVAEVTAVVALEAPLVIEEPSVVLVLAVLVWELVLPLVSAAWVAVSPLAGESDPAQAIVPVHTRAVPRKNKKRSEVAIGSVWCMVPSKGRRRTNTFERVRGFGSEATLASENCGVGKRADRR